MKEKKLNKKLSEEYDACRNLSDIFKSGFESWFSSFCSRKLKLKGKYTTVSNKKNTEYMIKFFEPVDNIIKKLKESYMKELNVKEGIFDLAFSIYQNDINTIIIRLNLE